jgi:hypothetical protein
MAKAEVGDRSGRPTSDSDEFVAGGSTVNGAGGLERFTTEMLAANPSMAWHVAAGDVIGLHPLTLHSAGAQPVAERWFCAVFPLLVPAAP